MKEETRTPRGKVQTDSKDTNELDVVGKPVVSVSGA